MQPSAFPEDISSNPALISALSSLGLSQYETKCFLASLQTGPAPINKIGIVSGVPRTKVYGAVRKLLERGLVEQDETDPKIFVARSPKEVLIPLMEHEQRRIKQGLESLNELEMIHRSMEYVKRADALSSNVHRYSPRNTVFQKTKELFGISKSKIVVLTTAYGLIRLSKIADVLYERSKLGMRLEIFSPTMDDPLFTTAVASLREVEKSEIVFVPPLIPIQLIVVDSQHLLISELKPDDVKDEGMDVAFLIRNQEMAEMLEDLIRVLAPLQRPVLGG